MNYPKILNSLKDRLLRHFGFEVSHGLSKHDYSFGSQKIRNIKAAVRRGNYRVAHADILNLSADDLTQTMDCLTMNLEEEVLEKWYVQSQKSISACLALGIFYGHKGWKIRSHAYSHKVSREDTLQFLEYQRKSAQLLQQIEKPNKLVVEAYSRLVKVFMSISEPAQANHYFLKCTELDPIHLWAHIHQAESLHPKWGGSVEASLDLLYNLPENPLLRQVIRLKMAADFFLILAITQGDGSKSVEEETRDTLWEIDQELRSNPLKSIQRFVVYAYLATIGQEIEESKIVKRYFHRMERNYPLYPFGLID